MEKLQVSFRVEKEFHAQIKSVCAMRHCTMKKWIMTAIAEKLAKDEAGMVKPGSSYRLDKSNSSS